MDLEKKLEKDRIKAFKEAMDAVNKAHAATTNAASKCARWYELCSGPEKGEALAAKGILKSVGLKVGTVVTRMGSL